MRRDAAGKLHPASISGTGAGRGHTLFYDGSRWKPGLRPTTVFSYAGIPSTSTYSPPFRVDGTASRIGLRGLLGTSGAANTTCGIYRGGSLLASVTLGSGVTDAVTTTDVALADGDLLKAHATAVGSGAVDLTLQMYLS